MPERIPEIRFTKKFIALPPLQQALVRQKLQKTPELRKRTTVLSERLEKLMQKDFEGTLQIQKLARTLRLMRIQRNQLTKQYAELMGLANEHVVRERKGFDSLENKTIAQLHFAGRELEWFDAYFHQAKKNLISEIEWQKTKRQK